MEFAGFTIWNTGVPLVLIGILAIILPFLLIRKDTRSHRSVALGVAIAAVLLVLAGALILWGIDTRDIEIAENASASVLFQIYLRASFPFAMLWAPLLALIWFGKAQRVEKLRGEDLVREGR